LGDAARKELLDRAGLCAPLTLSDAAPGAGFVSTQHPRTQQRGARVDVCLPVAPAGKDGASVFDEWSGIVAEAKHDLNREILLRLNFAEDGFRDFDLDGFRDGKRLGTTDIELEVRP